VQDMLEYVENTNWYRLSVDAEDKFTLVLTVSESSHFVKTFFEGLFRQYPRDVEFREESMKIRIRVQ
ncbi:MAG: CopG family transcriptional regulator, partial [Candidatus Thermoplasmatota archaeon]|nr:CopG family transcriptional regulator [Candidatus Thermoplasmatota archaeon]